MRGASEAAGFRHTSWWNGCWLPAPGSRTAARPLASHQRAHEHGRARSAFARAVGQKRDPRFMARSGSLLYCRLPKCVCSRVLEGVMRHFVALLVVLMVVALAPQARAEKSVALVLGNSGYMGAVELKNPRNDATDLAASLKLLGFEVIAGNDLDKRTMERTIREFGQKLVGADVALFFFAGHGLQVGGQNYMVPIDAQLASEGDVDFEGLPLALVLKQMEREAKTSIVLLDACRDNPLARNLARSMGTRGGQIGQGLAEVKAGVGALIGFSTQPGNVALDGEGRNSPYAGALVKHVVEAGRDVSAILVAVRNDVLQATGGRQVPWEHTSLTGQVYLQPESAPQAPLASGAPDYDKEMEIALWNAVKDSKSPAVLQTYLDRFPTGT